MKSLKKFALVGAGHIGGFIRAALEARAGAELVCACDLDSGAAAAAAAEWGIAAYSSIGQMLGAHPDLDVAIIATPTAAHFENARELLPHVHVFIEKPATTSLSRSSVCAMPSTTFALPRISVYRVTGSAAAGGRCKRLSRIERRAHRAAEVESAQQAFADGERHAPLGRVEDAAECVAGAGKRQVEIAGPGHIGFTAQCCEQRFELQCRHRAVESQTGVFAARVELDTALGIHRRRALRGRSRRCRGRCRLSASRRRSLAPCRRRAGRRR